MSLRTKLGYGATMSHSFVRLLHSSQQPKAPRAKDETPHEQHNRKVSSVAPQATKHTHAILF